MISSRRSFETKSDIDNQQNDVIYEKTLSTEKIGTIKTEIYWGNVVKLAALHLGAFYGFYLCFTASKWHTLSWGKHMTFLFRQGMI